MRRYGYLYENIVSMDALRAAAKKSSRGKNHYKEVREFRKDSNNNLLKLKKALEDKTYTTSIYCIHKKKDNGKDRTVFVLPYYPDRIVQHALMAVIAPIIEASLIRDTFQSIPGRGNLDCKRRLERFTISPEAESLYCLQVDISKFYPSVRPMVLKRKVRRIIKCPDALWLLDNILDSADELPIGNYPSQHLGNYYLSSTDHYMKQVAGCKAYFRYCDDIVILHETKEFLWNALKHLREKLAGIGLTIKNNYQVYPLSKRGIDFVGYVFHPGRTKLRKRIKQRFIRSRRNKKSIMSYYGWLKHCSAKQLWLKYGANTARYKHVPAYS